MNIIQFTYQNISWIGIVFVIILGSAVLLGVVGKKGIFLLTAVLLILPTIVTLSISGKEGEQSEVSYAEKEANVTIPAPEFSAESGFYEEAFELILSAEDGLQIYYTLDSSNPSEESEAYTSPIYVYDRSAEPNQYRSIQNVYRTYYQNEPIGLEPVDKCFVVRAVAVDANGNSSEIVTHSYFIDLDDYRDQRVISLVSDPDGLFGDDGIYVTGSEFDEWYEEMKQITPEGEEIDTTNRPLENYMQHGIEWERLANFELFDSGRSINNQFVGIRIQGMSTRFYKILKRFALYSRKKYSGSKWFDTDFFEGRKTHSVVIRDGDTNAIAQELASDRSAMNIQGEPVVLFLDGEYWYTSYLFEKLSEEYYAVHYGVNEENVIMARDGSTVTEGIDEKSTFEYLEDYVKTHDLTEEAEYIELQQMMDIQSYIDYWAMNIYLSNMDVSETMNIVTWRTYFKENEAYGDQKWRWVFYDMDLLTSKTRALETVDANTDAEVNSFNIKGKNVAYAIDEGTFWKALTANQEFCQQFVLSFMDIVNTNFTIANVERVLEKYGYDISYDDYFFQERPKYIIPDLAEEFGLSGTLETVTLSSNRSGAPVTLNTITPELSADGTWSGTYFTDYPVEVSADSADFDHWEVTSNGQTMIYTDIVIEVPVVAGGVLIKAVYGN